MDPWIRCLISFSFFLANKYEILAPRTLVDGGKGHRLGQIDDLGCLLIVGIFRVVLGHEADQGLVHISIDGGGNGRNKVDQSFMEVPFQVDQFDWNFYDELMQFQPHRHGPQQGRPRHNEDVKVGILRALDKEQDQDNPSHLDQGVLGHRVLELLQAVKEPGDVQHSVEQVQGQDKEHNPVVALKA